MPGAAAELIRKEIRGTFRLVDRPGVSAPAAAPAVRVVDNNPDRVSLLIVNSGAVSVEIGFTEGVTFGTGIRLSNNGGFFSTVWRDDFMAPTSPIFAIAGAAGAALRIVEILRDTGSEYAGTPEVTP